MGIFGLWPWICGREEGGREEGGRQEGGRQDGRREAEREGGNERGKFISRKYKYMYKQVAMCIKLQGAICSFAQGSQRFIAYTSVHVHLYVSVACICFTLYLQILDYPAFRIPIHTPSAPVEYAFQFTL